jgi:hypothetical protein
MASRHRCEVFKKIVFVAAQEQTVKIVGAIGRRPQEVRVQNGRYYVHVSLLQCGSPLAPVSSVSENSLSCRAFLASHGCLGLFPVSVWVQY